MKPIPSAALASGLLLLAGACATEPPTRIYGPGPQTQAGTTAPSAALEGRIAECGHPGAEEARLFYPGGWHQRLSEVAATSGSGGELLGGPVTSEVVDHEARPVSPPVPDYPAGPASRGLEAKCEAMMDVTKAGMPEDIITACSSPEFNTATLEAVSKLEFAPKTVDGREVRRLNVVYPVTYCLKDGTPSPSG